MQLSELDRLRQRGVAIFVIVAWSWAFCLPVIAWLFGVPQPWAAIAIALALNIAPTMVAIGRRYDLVARLLCATLAAAYPALTVFVLSGHPWQMDGHMYFFVALAALTILCDWKPLALASVLVAFHHVLVEFFAPSWAFPGSGNIDRVLIHALAVALQFSILSYVTIQLRQLMARQTVAGNESERLATEAIERRAEVEQALRAARDAEVREAAERERRERLEREGAARRRTEMLALAAAFEASIADIVGAVGTSSGELENSARSLNELAQRASRETTETAATASQSSTNADTLATRIRELSTSITAIGTRVDRQAKLSGDARDVSASGHEAVRVLADRTHSIAGFAETIDDISSRTNLLSLNATIEAARAGEVGRGFAVVAGEVKQLASQTSVATGEIRTLAGSVQSGADIANEALHNISDLVTELAEAADSIMASVEVQRTTAAAIEATARETAFGATRIAEQVVSVAAVAGDTETLSSRVSDAATDLSVTARRLQRATEQFVSQLSAA